MVGVSPPGRKSLSAVNDTDAINSNFRIDFSARLVELMPIGKIQREVGR